MSIHTKEIIIKSLLVICGVCATLLCPIGIILLIIIAEEWFYMLFNYYTLFLTGLGAITLILYGIFSSTVKGGYEAKIADSQKHPSCFATYEDLAKNIKNALINKNYEVCTEEKEFEFGHISLYVERESRISTTSVWITLRLLSIESDIWEDLQKAIMAEIDTCCGFAAGKLELTVLLCVDRVSTNFYKTINKEIRQHDNFTWLLAGVSFGGKIIYVAQQHGGVSYKKYKQLRSHFLDVMQISTDRNEIEQK